tara:strand:+ start:7718 stop:8548 length:831 start_codon:yes stop_codon:yes gene_type:complete
LKKDNFSKRQGFHSFNRKEIVVREEAPEGLRGFIRMAFYNLKKKPSDLRSIASRVLKIPPDRNNWSDYPNIDYEVEEHLENCQWFKVYDIIEAIIQSLDRQQALDFTDEINEYFIENGIGWKIENGLVETRGDEVFETAVKTVEKVLETAKLPTAKTEIKEALKDLSRRPEPDITGAIQHSLACLECVAREVSGNKKATLGELIKKHPNIVPKPLDAAIEKIWGFTSEQGRHLKEGNAPDYLEAELVVELTAAISTYLGKKLSGTTKTSEDDDLLF